MPSRAAQATIDLYSDSSYAVLAGSSITNAGSTTLCGDLGLFPGTVVSGSPQLSCGGVFHINDGPASSAQGDLTTAYNDATSRSGGVTFTAIYDIGGQTFTPDLYTEPTSLGITGSVTLDGQGDSNAIFIFKIGSTLITIANSQVILVNGAQAANVFWRVGSSCTLGMNTVFKGNLLVDVTITVNSGAALEGRALARTGAVGLNGNNSTLATPTATATVTATSTSTPTETPTPVGAVGGAGLTPDGVFGSDHNGFDPALESVLLYYKVPAKAHVQLSVYNLMGRRVRSLVDGEKTANTWSVAWDGRNDQGSLVASDVYFLLIKIGDARYVRKVAVLRERKP